MYCSFVLVFLLWCVVCSWWTVRLKVFCLFLFFFKQKTAYEMRISDWSSDVCSSDLQPLERRHVLVYAGKVGEPLFVVPRGAMHDAAEEIDGAAGGRSNVHVDVRPSVPLQTA